jgi:hypothetical protein
LPGGAAAACGAIAGPPDLAGDLVDQWPSDAHGRNGGACYARWSRFRRPPAQRHLASGEVHLGALGLIESRGTRIYQLISSGIVHPPPSARAVRLLEWVGARSPALAPDLTARPLLLPGRDQRFLRARNWLELELSPDGGLTATWHSEGGGPGARLSIAPEDARTSLSVSRCNRSYATGYVASRGVMS